MGRTGSLDAAVAAGLWTGPSAATWQRIHFDVIIKGDDWRGTPKGDALEREFAPLGVEIAYLPYTVHTSSTMLRQVLHQRVAGS